MAATGRRSVSGDRRAPGSAPSRASRRESETARSRRPLVTRPGTTAAPRAAAHAWTTRATKTRDAHGRSCRATATRRRSREPHGAPGRTRPRAASFLSFVERLYPLGLAGARASRRSEGSRLPAESPAWGSIRDAGVTTPAEGRGLAPRARRASPAFVCGGSGGVERKLGPRRGLSGVGPALHGPPEARAGRLRRNDPAALRSPLLSGSRAGASSALPGGHMAARQKLPRASPSDHQTRPAAAKAQSAAGQSPPLCRVG